MSTTNTIDLTATDDENDDLNTEHKTTKRARVNDDDRLSSSTSKNTTKARQTTMQIFLVFSQEEPYYGGIHSGYFETPKNVNKELIGVYNNVKDANEAVRDHWAKLGFEDEDDEEEYKGHLCFFWDALQRGGDATVMSLRVFVEEHTMTCS